MPMNSVEQFNKVLDELEGAVRDEIAKWPEQPGPPESYTSFETGQQLPADMLPDEISPIPHERAAEHSRQLVAFVHEVFDAARAVVADPDLLKKQKEQVAELGEPASFPLAISPAAQKRIDDWLAKVGPRSSGVSVEALKASGAVEIVRTDRVTVSDAELRKGGVNPEQWGLKGEDGNRTFTHAIYALDRGAVDRSQEGTNVQALVGGRSFGPTPQVPKVTELQWPDGLLSEKARGAISKKYRSVLGQFNGYASRGFTQAELKSMSPDEAWEKVVRWEPWDPPTKIPDDFSFQPPPADAVNDGQVLRVCMPSIYLSTVVLPENRGLAVEKLAAAINKLAEADLLAGHMALALGSVTLAPPAGEAVFSFLMLAPTRKWRLDEREGEHFLEPFRRFLGTDLASLVVPEGDVGTRLIPDERLACPGCQQLRASSDLVGPNMLVPGAMVCQSCMQRLTELVKAARAD